MELIESSLTSKFQITVPKIVREKLGITNEKDQLVFLMEDETVRLIKKPQNIMEAMEKISGGYKVSAKQIRQDIKRDRAQW